jgi:hypothetical protein
VRVPVPVDETLTVFRSNAANAAGFNPSGGCESPVVTLTSKAPTVPLKKVINYELG